LHKQTHILSTRPLTPSLIATAAARNIIIISDSFITTIAVNDPQNRKEIKRLADEELVAVFTSMNAADAVAAELKDKQPAWKIFSIGTTTKNILQKRFKDSNIIGGAENAASLADQIISEGNTHSVIFFCGDQRRDELPEKLNEHNIQVKEIIVYKTVPQPHRLERTYDGIMFFSPSAVESFFVNNTVPPETIFFSIGDTTRKTIEQYSTNKVITSDHPGKEDLVNKVILYFNTINQH
jgi:uroporphyrinogen-III synthase